MSQWLVILERAITASGGGGQALTPERLKGIAFHLVVEAATATTLFDFAIKNAKGFKVYRRAQQKGIMNEGGLEIPLLGPMTLLIENATKDEDFDVVIYHRLAGG